MKKTVTWILTADHQCARAFANDGLGRGVRTVDGFAMQAQLPSSHEAGSHRPDIGFASKDGRGHGVVGGDRRARLAGPAGKQHQHARARSAGPQALHVQREGALGRVGAIERHHERSALHGRTLREGGERDGRGSCRDRADAHGNHRDG